MGKFASEDPNDEYEIFRELSNVCIEDLLVLPPITSNGNAAAYKIRFVQINLKQCKIDSEHLLHLLLSMKLKKII